MTPRTWTIADPPPTDFRTGFSHLPVLVQYVLWRRGLTTPAAVEAFLQPEYRRLADPFAFRQMRPAVDRIRRALERQEPIMIYGDYDADGVTATAVLYETLSALGGAVRWYLPERLTEGYGLNLQAIEEFARTGTNILITVDCGTSNVEEIQRAKSLGLDVIVIDHHHQPPIVPPALAIINPVMAGETYPDRGLSSAGVAFAVVRALLASTDYGARLGHPLPTGRQALAPGWEKWLLDLVAISTVADMMPLRGENRTLVHYGLLTLRQTRRPGLRALFAIMGSPLERADELTIGFTVAPRLNAAGRLQHASIALELLLTHDPDRAQRLAEQLQSINLDRQRLTTMAVAEALEQTDLASRQAGQEQPRYGGVTAFASHWSPGILGLVAGQLADRLWRPTVVMAENDGQIVGSGRSVSGVNIMTIMDEGREYFLRYGGHAGACGFTLRSPAQRLTFERWFRDRIADGWQPAQATKELIIDGRARLSDVTADALDMLATLGPYGIDHTRPVFLLERVRVLDVGTVGAEQQHLRLTVGQGRDVARCIGFRQGSRLADAAAGREIDLAVETTWNEWQGRREAQLKIIDLRLPTGRQGSAR
mgnify:CR=1 FL=1